jgi:hypothetical protein
VRIEILATARKHGIADEDIRHALRNAIFDYLNQGDHELTMAVGPARKRGDHGGSRLPVERGRFSGRRPCHARQAKVYRGRVTTMPRSYEEIVNQAEELSRVFEADFQPAVSREEATVRAAALRRALAESELGEAVAAARKAGVPWDRIGEAVGTSGEAARQKYRALAGKEKPVTAGH